jgi:hypothetical protein
MDISYEQDQASGCSQIKTREKMSLTANGRQVDDVQSIDWTYYHH